MATTFQNTEMSFGVSGVNANFFASNISWQSLRVLSGQAGANVAGPVLVKAIFATVTSGFTGASSSGNILVVAHAVSGATSGGVSTTGDILFYHYGGASGASLEIPPMLNLDFMAKSGISAFATGSGGTRAYDLNIIYGSKIA